MNDHVNTMVQIAGHVRALVNPDNYRVHHRLCDVRDVVNLPYDFFLLDRDGTLQGYHGSVRVPAFEESLRALGKKAEIISNSSFDEVCRIRDVFSDVVPVSQVVYLKGNDAPHIVRWDNHQLNVFSYVPQNGLVQEVVMDESMLRSSRDRQLKKPNPLVLRAVIDVNIALRRVPHQPRVLMVGDRYLTDIVAGNCAGVHTALVDPVAPATDPFVLWLTRYGIDVPVGALMSRV